MPQLSDNNNDGGYSVKEATAPVSKRLVQPVPGSDDVTIFVVARHDIYVDGLVRVISGLDGYDVKECAMPGNDCFAMFHDNPADMLLLEESVVTQHLQKTTVDELFGDFRQHYPGLRIVIFGRELEDAFIRKLIRAGAHGFIDSTMTQQTLQLALNEVHNGGYWVSQQALKQLIYSAVEIERIVEQGIRDKVEAFQKTLTERESDVLHCVLEGLSTREIAAQMCLSEQSVKLHLGRLFRKFEVTNRSQLILMAFARVCPVNNMIQLFRKGLDKQRLHKGRAPLIRDPLASST